MSSPSASAIAAAPRSRFIAVSRRMLGPIWRRVGFTATLTVQGRRSGEPSRAVVFPLEVGGATYLLSQYGESAWVRNLRAAGRGELVQRGRTRSVTATEVQGDERDRVIAAFRAKTPGPFRRDYEQHPDPADHPAFRMDPLS